MTSSEFEKIITSSDSSRGETIEIHYRNGSTVEGFVQYISYDSSPAYVNLCKSVVPRGENSDHTVRFDDIVRLIVKQYGKEPIIHE